MRLPHLDQLIPLERGEAGLLARAIAVLLSEAQRIAKGQANKGLRLTPIRALQLTPLTKLGKRLVARHNQEQARPLKAGRRPAARTLGVRDELVAVLDSRASLYDTGVAETEKWQLQRVLGEFQRHSLNLERCLDFAR